MFLPTDYVFCDNEASLQIALTAIQATSQNIILDCEGLNLGQQGGTLSLITLRTTGLAPQIFIIDVIGIGITPLRPLFDLLESPALHKVVFDGRMDYSALYHEHGVTLDGLLDLQLADIQSRTLRGEDMNNQLRRLSPYLYKREISSQRTSYTSVQKLSGLGQCMREHRLEGAKSKASSGQNYPTTHTYLSYQTLVNHAQWLNRPLSREQLHYAAFDVCCIGKVYELFTAKGYLAGETADQNMRYISMWKDAQPKMLDVYKNHPLLPLEILDQPSDYYKKPCIICERDLSESSYSKVAWTSASKQQCWVCRALTVKNNKRIQRERDMGSRQLLL